MAAFLIEIQRGAEWRKLTEVPITLSSPADEAAARQRAEREAKRQCSGWAGHFRYDRIRIREVA